METSKEAVIINENEILLSVLCLMDKATELVEVVESSLDDFLNSRSERQEMSVIDLQAIDYVSQIQGDIRVLVEQLKTLQDASTDLRVTEIQSVLKHLKLEKSRNILEYSTSSNQCFNKEQFARNSKTSQEVDLF